MLEAFHALIVDGDVQARVRLKETLRNIVYKTEIQFARTLKEAEAALRYGANYDGVFVASNHNQADLLDFVLNGHQSQGGRHASYILILKANERESSYVASLYLSGVDGFVCEPYVAAEMSVLLESLLKDTKRKREEEEKKRAVLGFLVLDLAKGIDQRYLELASMMKHSQGGYTMKGLRETSTRLQDIAKDCLYLYEDVLAAKLQDLPPPKPPQAFKKKKAKKERMKHPGEAVARILFERNIPAGAVSPRLGLSEAEFGDLLNGNFHVTEDLAKKLAHVLGNTVGFWIHLQNMCDARKAELEQRSE